jgi:hypothetical protein
MIAGLFQAGAEHDAALAAADDDDIGLDGGAKRLFLKGFQLRPGLAVAVGAVADAHRAGEAGGFLVARDGLQRGEYGAGLAPFQPHNALDLPHG